MLRVWMARIGVDSDSTGIHREDAMDIDSLTCDETEVAHEVEQREPVVAQAGAVTRKQSQLAPRPEEAAGSGAAQSESEMDEDIERHTGSGQSPTTFR